MTRKKPAPMNRYVVRLHPSRVVIWHVEAESLDAAEAICADVLPTSVAKVELTWNGPVVK